MTRSIEQLRNHYEVEKALANKLKNAPREERPSIYLKMYEELFAKVPDHPRLSRRESPAATRKRIQRTISLVGKMLRPSSIFLEFGPGDCRAAFEVCKHVSKVYAVDICEQIGHFQSVPDNFEFVPYNGYELPLPDRSVDMMFSDQLIEHIHPEDIEIHFQNARRVLKPGGQYLLVTPHRFTGPHDISRYFSDQAEGFHLKEWIYHEIALVIKSVGFSKIKYFRVVRGMPVRVPGALILLLETVIGILPRHLKIRLGRIMVPNIVLSAVK